MGSAEGLRVQLACTSSTRSSPVRPSGPSGPSGPRASPSRQIGHTPARIVPSHQVGFSRRQALSASSFKTAGPLVRHDWLRNAGLRRLSGVGWHSLRPCNFPPWVMRTSLLRHEATHSCCCLSYQRLPFGGPRISLTAEAVVPDPSALYVAFRHNARMTASNGRGAGVYISSPAFARLRKPSSSLHSHLHPKSILHPLQTWPI